MATKKDKSPTHPLPAAPQASPTPNLSPDVFRTLLFVGVAAACLLVTLFIQLGTSPAPIEKFGRVGQEYNPDFIDPTLATSLEVSAFNADEGHLLEFRVERLDDGRWVIPSHHNYPADAKERLGKTAASVIGIKRGALMTRWADEHKNYGVVDPTGKRLEIADLEGIGKRLTLRDEKGEALVDYIIGNQVEDKEGQYYVRSPDEEEVYIADLDIDLSTKFTDWIVTDLLDVDAFDIRQVTINDYELNERGISATEVSELSRDSSSGPWKLAGLNEETEEVEKDAVRDTVDAIAGLKIAGVRPKQNGLTPSLEVDPNAKDYELARLPIDLRARGFHLLQRRGQEELELIAQEGELFASTEEGLVYRLYFGRAFTGSEEEIEIGSSNEESGDEEGEKKKEDPSDESSGVESSGDDESKEDPKKDEEADQQDKGDSESEGDADKASESEEGGDDDKKADDGKPGRYVFVRVEFDQTKLGEEPVMPVEPQEPSSEPEPADDAKEKDSGDSKDGDATSKDGDAAADKKAGEENAAKKAADDATKKDATKKDATKKDATKKDATKKDATKKDATKKGDAKKGDAAKSETEAGDDEKKDEEPVPDPQKLYEEAKQQYQFDLRKYERDTEEFKEKVEKGQKKADDLNRRFAEWYYVIPGDSYEKLSLSRANLVKAKEMKPEEGESKDGDGAPGAADGAKATKPNDE